MFGIIIYDNLNITEYIKYLSKAYLRYIYMYDMLCIIIDAIYY